GGALTELDVAEPDIEQRVELACDGRDAGEEFARLLAGHLQHFGDGAALVVHLQRLAVVALAVADVARDVDVGQEMHFHPRHAVPLTGLAAPPLHVEREPARTVAALTRSRHAREQLAYGREQSG